MNLLKGLLKALRLHKNKSSSQLLKCILLNTALELSTYADQSFSPELFGCIQFEPNHWLNFYKDINTFARMPNPSHQLMPCLPKPSCLVQQCFENQTDNNKSSDVPSTVKSSSIPLHETDWLESSSVAGTPQKPCIASELGTPNGNTPAKESMVCCRNWSPLTLQIRILQNDDCSPHSTLVFDSSTPPKKNILNCDRCSSSTTKSSCSTVQLNLTNTKTHCDTGMQVQDLKVLDANYPDKHLSRSIGCPVSQDCVDRGVQTDPPLQQLLSRSSSSEQEKEQSLCGTFQQDYIDAKQSILWDSYDLHLSRSLINGSPSPQIPDWTLSEHGELCGIEKRASDAESNLKVGKTRKMQHEFENQSFIKPYPRNVYKTPTSQKLGRRAVGMGLFSSTPNRKDLKLRRKWNLKKSAGQISFPHSIKEETYLIDETNGLLEYSDFSYRQTMENNLTRMCV